MMLIVRIWSCARPLVEKTCVKISLHETTRKRVDDSIIGESGSLIGTSLTVLFSPLSEVMRNARQAVAAVLASIVGYYVVQEAMKLDEWNWNSTWSAGDIDQIGVAVFCRGCLSRVECSRDGCKCRNPCRQNGITSQKPDKATTI
jgi:hypothetical protein